MDVNVGGDWSRYAALTTNNPPISDEGSTPVGGLAPLTTFDFSGWDAPIPIESTDSDGNPVGSVFLGFSPQGTPQRVTRSSMSRASIKGGTWIGVRGLTIKDKGLPYGCVFLLDNGLITAYYKPDALLTDAPNQWQRLE